MQAECLRSQFAPLAARYRSCSSNRQRTSAAQCLGSQIAPMAARYRSCSSNRQRTSAAQCLGSQFAPLAARYRSCSSSRQRTCAGVAHQAIRAKGRRLNAASVQTASARPRPSAWALNSPPGSSLSLVLIERPAHVRGPVPGLSIRAPGSSLSLVLIKPPAHVRGPVPGLSIRAPGSSLPLVLIKPPAHVRGGCTPGNSRRVAARDNSRPGAVSYAHACANRQRTCAPGVVHGTFSVPALYILQGPP